MIEAFRDALMALQAEAATYPVGVRTWLNVMSISFFVGIVFVLYTRRAMWVVGIMILTAVVLILAKVGFPELTRSQIGTVSHLILWPFALLGLWRQEYLRQTMPKSNVARLFKPWKYWVTILMTVSIFLDVRTLVSWL